MRKTTKRPKKQTPRLSNPALVRRLWAVLHDKGTAD
jgi:hypothetical protein